MEKTPLLKQLNLNTILGLATSIATLNFLVNTFREFIEAEKACAQMPIVSQITSKDLICARVKTYVDLENPIGDIGAEVQIAF